MRHFCRATILRNGEVVAACNPQLETSASLARLMISPDLPESIERKERSVGSVCLRVNNLTLEVRTFVWHTITADQF